MKTSTLISTILITVAASGCATWDNMSSREKSASTGAAVGGVAGAVISNGGLLGTVGGAAIGGVIERHLVSIGFIEGEGMGLKSDPQAEVIALNPRPTKACESCGGFDLRMVEGCMTCGSCGQSKCG